MGNLVLIGMPSAGKSSVGALLARRLGYGFLDGDQLICRKEGALLSEIIEKKGTECFLAIEERVYLGLNPRRQIISTGGSAVYSDAAMRRLQEIGTVVYLKIGADEVKRRIPSFAARGVVLRGDVKTAEELYAERAPLYERYACITVECDGKSTEEIAEEILLKTEV